MDQIITTVRSFPGALVVVPAPGGEFPELVWGDAFFYYAPDGRMPRTVQPYGTIVTKNHPGDTASDLDPPGRWRVNVHVGRPAFRRLTGEEPRALTRPRDHAAADTVTPHPVYGPLGWISVVNPAEHTLDLVTRLLHDAHVHARTRFDRRTRGGGGTVAERP
ncbi:DUF6194 family protein [Streptomyces sp. NPDC001388]|uniref:DUF6194 family protein n=1 Tax=unclassified Streptomyces TaxID=2593676 RepID=UPI0036BDC3DE